MAIGDVGKMGKMLVQARKAQSKMKKLEVAGQSASISMVMNGLYEVQDVEIDKDVLKSDLSNLTLDEEMLREISEYFEDNIEKAVNDAKKQLEKTLSSSANMDDLKEMLGV